MLKNIPDQQTPAETFHHYLLYVTYVFSIISKFQFVTIDLNSLKKSRRADES